MELAHSSKAEVVFNCFLSIANPASPRVSTPIPNPQISVGSRKLGTMPIQLLVMKHDEEVRIDVLDFPEVPWVSPRGENIPHSIRAFRILQTPQLRDFLHSPQKALIQPCCPEPSQKKLFKL
jgi:hypothetical protein